MNIFADENELVALIDQRYLVSFLNPFSYAALCNNRGVMENIDFFGFDGIALQLMYRFIRRRGVARISFDFTSIADDVFNYCEKTRKSIAVVGSTQSAIDDFASLLRQRYPQLNISFLRNGYISAAERAAVINSIVEIAPDVLLCGMGAPLQEQFLIDVRAAGWRGAGFTCGGFIHQTASSNGDYYPVWIDKCNLRFLYRIWDEPKLWRRYLFSYPRGVFYFVKDCLKNNE